MVTQQPEPPPFLAAILDSPSVALIGTEVQNRVSRWSNGAHRIYGYGAVEIEGDSILRIVPPDRHDEIGRVLEQVRRGEHVEQHETIGLTKHGTFIDVELAASPVRDARGQVTGACVLARDITAQRWMENTLESSVQALEEALGAARESETRCQRFLSDAAHQLRTPIAGIQTCADALVRGAPATRQEELLDHVLHETSRASRLMTGLLHIARLDQGESRAPRRCDIVGLCEDEADHLRVVAPQIDVVVAAPMESEIKGACDIDALREIVSNLLDNAGRHATSKVEVSVGCNDDMVEVWVIDDGPGVPEPQRERIFERFVSLDGKGGSGLGLPIARGLVRSHGGDLTYEDGAFVVRLPLEPRATPGPWGGQLPPPAVPKSTSPLRPRSERSKVS